MPIIYLSTVNKFLGKHSVFTPQELDYCDSLEKEWQDNQPQYSTYQLLEIFPDARLTVRRLCKEKIQQYKKDLRQALETKRFFNNEILSRVKYQNRWFYELVRDIIYVNPLREGREQKIKRARFALSALNPKTKTKTLSRITDEDILKAKEMPIETLYIGQLTKKGALLTGLCPFHNDRRTPNFFIYTKQNSFWCYVCSFGGSVIDFIKKRDDCDFITAVKKLLNK